jgi:hypothetical protein
MRKLGTAILLAAGALLSTAANAQSWGVYIGNTPDYYGHDGYGRQGVWDDDVNATCSGQRARALEWRLRHEYEENEISGWDADRINRQIDRLERKQDHECQEGDWGAVRNISYQYRQIDQWIDQMAHGRWRGD